MRAPCSGGVGPFGICRKEKHVAIATGTKQHGVGAVRFNLASDQITGNDSACLAVDDHDVKQFGPVVHFDLTVRDLTVKRAVRAKQQLLSRLSTSIEGT